MKTKPSKPNKPDTLKIEYLRGKVGKVTRIQRNIAEDLIERGYAKEVEGK